MPMIQGLVLKPYSAAFLQPIDGLFALELASVHRRKVAQAVRMHRKARRGVFGVDALAEAVEVGFGVEVADVKDRMARGKLPLEGHDGIIIHVLLDKTVCPRSGCLCPGDALGYITAFSSMAVWTDLVMAFSVPSVTASSSSL